MIPRPYSDTPFDFPEILDLETNHNSFWVCHLHLFYFFSKTFSKQLYIKIKLLDQSPKTVYNALLRNGMLHKIMLVQTICTSSKSKPSPVAIVCGWMNTDTTSSIEAVTSGKGKKKRKDESPYRIQLCTYVTHTTSIISRRTMEAKQGETKAFKHENSWYTERLLSD